jgi:hypothetical protein
MVNVVVSRRRNIKVSSNSTAGVIDTTVPVTLKNVPIISNGIDTIDEMHDVNLTQRNDGSTLVYDEPSDTYVVKKIDFGDIVGDLDGGTF